MNTKSKSSHDNARATCIEKTKTGVWRTARRLAFATIALILGATAPSLQAASISAWDFTGQSSPATSNASSSNANLSSVPVLTRGAGAASSTASNSFRTTGFQNNGIATANTDYFQTTLQAASGYTLSLSTIDARFAGTAGFAVSPGVSQQFAYSLDGTTFTLIGSPASVVGTPAALTQISLTGIAALQNVPSSVTVYLRYYASGQSTTGGWGFNSPSSGSMGLDIGGTVSVGLASEPTTHSSALSFPDVQSGQMNVSWTPGNGAARIVVAKAGGAPTGVPADGTSYTANATYGSGAAVGDGFVVYNGSGSSFTLTDLTPSTTYFFTIYEYNGSAATTNYLTSGTPGSGSQSTMASSNSTASDIVAAAGFTESANIDYAAYQAAVGLTAATSVEVARFTIRDGGTSADADTAATTLSAITFTATNGTALRRVGLFDGTTEIAEIDGSGTLTFNGLSGVAAADDGTKEFSLRATFNSTVTDNQQLQFTVASATASASGSSFAAANAGGAATSIVGDANRLEVAASKLVFSGVPGSTTVGANFSATVQAQDANNNLDADSTAAVMIAIATGTGNLSGGAAQNLVAGAFTFSTLQIDEGGVFTIQASGGALTPAVSGNITVLVPVVQTANFAPIATYFPQVMSSGNTTRLPTMFRATVSGLSANTLYRYYMSATIASDIGGTASGAGNTVLVSADGTTFSYGASGSLSGTFETFTTDATGQYTGWFGLVNTGNARFTAGNTVFPTIIIGNATGTLLKQWAAQTGIAVLTFSTSAGANNGTGIRGTSFATAKNFVAIYDNTAGTGRPLALTYAESEGLNIASTVAFYGTAGTGPVDGIAGAWGTIIPNTLASGVQRIAQFNNAGTLVGASTDADGAWPSGVSTVNPAGGTTALVVTSTDAPLVAPLTITATVVAGSGVISPSGATTVAYGGGQSYTFTPDTGYVIQDVLIDGVSIGAAVDYTFTNVTTNHTVDVTFAPLTYTLTYAGNGSTGGTAPVDPNSPYDHGSTVTVLGPGTLVKAGFVFASWNTASDGSGTSYNPADTFTITATTTLYAQWSLGLGGELNFVNVPITVNPVTNTGALTVIPVEITRTGATGGIISVRVRANVSSSVPAAQRLANGTDYTFETPYKTVTFADGDVSETILVPLKTGARFGQFLLELSDETGTGATIGAASTAVITVNKKDPSAPGLTVTFPATPASSASVTVTGTATDAGSVTSGIDRVEVTVSNINTSGTTFTTTPSSPGNTFAFSQGLTLQHGANKITVTAFDKQGNKTAKSSTINYSNPDVTGLAGTYTGLLVPSGTPSHDTSGFLTLTVTGTGTASGKLTLSGVVVSFSGALDSAGAVHFKPTLGAALPVIDKTELESYLGSLTISVAGTVATGTLSTAPSGGMTLATASAVKNATAAAAGLLGSSSAAQKYTVVFKSKTQGTLDEDEYPQGNGYAAVTVSPNASVAVAGSLADGTTYSASGKLHVLDDDTQSVSLLSVHYRKGGSFAIELVFDSTAAANTVSVSSVDSLWIRPVNTRARYYKDGWTSGIDVEAAGARYTVPASASVLPGLTATSPNAQLKFEDGGLLVAETRALDVTVKNSSINKSDDTALKLSFSAGTGIFKGVFTHADDSKPAFQGIVLQATGQLSTGYFLNLPPLVYGLSGQSGKVTLQPAPLTP